MHSTIHLKSGQDLNFLPLLWSKLCILYSEKRRGISCHWLHQLLNIWSWTDDFSLSSSEHHENEIDFWLLCIHNISKFDCLWGKRKWKMNSIHIRTRFYNNRKTNLKFQISFEIFSSFMDFMIRVDFKSMGNWLNKIVFLFCLSESLKTTLKYKQQFELGWDRNELANYSFPASRFFFFGVHVPRQTAVIKCNF